MKNVCKIITIFLSFILLGCESMQSDVDLIKGGTLNSNKTITIGQAFDNWKECLNREWKSFQTDNGVRIVEFKCESKSKLEQVQKKVNVDRKQVEARTKKRCTSSRHSKKFVEIVRKYTLEIIDENPKWQEKYMVDTRGLEENDVVCRRTIVDRFTKEIEKEDSSFKNKIDKLVNEMLLNKECYQNGIVDDELKREILKHTKFYLIVQFSLNQDDTFQINYYGGRGETEDGESKDQSRGCGSLDRVLRNIYSNDFCYASWWNLKIGTLEF